MARVTGKSSVGDEKQKTPSDNVSSPAQSKDAELPHSEIPKFDLAEQILAEQRSASLLVTLPFRAENRPGGNARPVDGDYV